MAKSSARFTEETKSGIKTEKNVLIVFKMFLFLKFAPRDFCAFNILFACSKTVGTNRRVMVIVKAMSLELSPIKLSGFKIFSIAKEISLGEVVNISAEAVKTSDINLKNTIALFSTHFCETKNCPFVIKLE